MGLVYAPSNPVPQNISVDMDNFQTFEATVNGAEITDYQLIIRDLSNTLEYDTGKTALASHLSDRDTLPVSVPSGTVSNGQLYKWELTTWSDSDEATKYEIAFKASSTPVIGFTVPSTITTRSYDFQATYTQAESVGIKFYEFNLYDSSGDLLDTTGEVISFNMQYTYDGFLEGESYSIEIVGETQDGLEFDTGLSYFDIEYDSPSLSISPVITFNPINSFYNIEWGEIVQIDGTETGTGNFFEDFIYEGNTGYLLDENSKIEYDVSIPVENTINLKWQPKYNDYTGENLIYDLDDGVFEFGINYDTGRFFARAGVFLVESQPVDVKGYVFYISFTRSIIYINGVKLYKTWDEIYDDGNRTWTDVLNTGDWSNTLYE